MSSSASFSTVRPFGDLPVQRRGDQWLLTTGSRAVPADRPLAADLDRLAVAMAAANQAVAALPPQSGAR
jgi:hypothetical protein